jgi:hypothetical protein
MRSDTTRSTGPLIVAVLAGIAHLVVGYFYLVSGLVVPGYALLPLWVFWGLLAWLLVRLAVRGSWWTALVPVIALGTWWLVLLFGGNVLGWQA